MLAVSLGAITVATGLFYRDALESRKEILVQVVSRYQRALMATIEQHMLHADKQHGKT